VLGGGPAGAAAALRLSQLGHQVMLVDRPRRARGHAGESLPPSVLPLLATLGLREQVERAGFLRARGAIVHWHTGESPAGQDRSIEAGLQVERERFDAMLLDGARAAGVQVLRAFAEAPVRVDSHWQVPLREGGLVRCRMLIDARGRRAHAIEGPRTVALCADWAGPSVADSRARIEAGASAWCWALPLPDGGVTAAVFVDAQRCAGIGAVERTGLYQGLLAASPLLAGLLPGRRCGKVMACDATPGAVADAAPEPGLLRVGEAAFALDPLSSQGVAAALRSGVQAATCVRTALRRPGDAALAWEFHRAQARRAVRRHARLAGNYYAQAAQRHDDVFWSSRARPDDPARSERPWPGLDQRLVLDAQARWSREPALADDWVRACDALRHPALDAPIAYLGGQPVGDWLSPLASRPALGDLLDIWHRRFGENRTLAVWPMLWRKGLLVPSQHWED
jgi:flavin-dependent dehydrogenase